MNHGTGDDLVLCQGVYLGEFFGCTCSIFRKMICPVVGVVCSGTCCHVSAGCRVGEHWGVVWFPKGQGGLLGNTLSCAVYIC